MFYVNMPVPVPQAGMKSVRQQVDGVPHDQADAQPGQQQEARRHEALLHVGGQLLAAAQGLHTQQDQVAAIKGWEWQYVDRSQVDVDDGTELE
mmetsp:Transcript_34345/g.70237  ORF Transcript_34345/g.70237 Transcript_34345/m.70237 type:complete len:93 (-) Transcript_34345:284-562(-)